jgi:hypothetical protein
VTFATVHLLASDLAATRGSLPPRNIHRSLEEPPESRFFEAPFFALRTATPHERIPHDYLSLVLSNSPALRDPVRPHSESH